MCPVLNTDWVKVFCILCSSPPQIYSVCDKNVIVTKIPSPAYICTCIYMVVTHVPLLNKVVDVSSYICQLIVFCVSTCTSLPLA